MYRFVLSLVLSCIVTFISFKDAKIYTFELNKIHDQILFFLRLLKAITFTFAV